MALLGFSIVLLLPEIVLALALIALALAIVVGIPVGIVFLYILSWILIWEKRRKSCFTIVYYIVSLHLSPIILLPLSALGLALGIPISLLIIAVATVMYYLILLWAIFYWSIGSRCLVNRDPSQPRQ